MHTNTNVCSCVLRVSGVLPISFEQSLHYQESVMYRGIDNREKDSIQSEKNKSIVYSYVTKMFDSCTAVKELHVEITPNQVFTLLGPVHSICFFNHRMVVVRQLRFRC